MTPRAKLATLEIISGLFGWVWIGASLAALAFAGFALFGDGSWWNVLYAVIAGAVAKWLAAGFRDHQRRVAFETRVAADGVPVEQARQAWLDAYTGQRSVLPEVGQAPAGRQADANRIKAKERARIVSEYGAFLERNPVASGVEIHDASRLPHTKAVILDAICLEIVREPDDAKVEALKRAALFLADYQDGVGDRPLSMLGVDLTSTDPARLGEEDAKAMAARIAGNPDHERFERYKSLADKDLVDIQAKLHAAERLRRDMPGDKKREVLG